MEDFGSGPRFGVKKWSRYGCPADSMLIKHFVKTVRRTYALAQYRSMHSDNGNRPNRLTFKMSTPHVALGSRLNDRSHVAARGLSVGGHRVTFQGRRRAYSYAAHSARRGVAGTGGPSGSSGAGGHWPLQRHPEKLQQETARTSSNVLIRVQDRETSLLQSGIAEGGDTGPLLPAGGFETQFGGGLTGGNVGAGSAACSTISTRPNGTDNAAARQQGWERGRRRPSCGGRSWASISTARRSPPPLSSDRRL